MARRRKQQQNKRNAGQSVSKRVRIDAEIAEGDGPAAEQAPEVAPARQEALQEVPQAPEPVQRRLAARQPFPFDITVEDIQREIISRVYDDADIYKQIRMRELGSLWNKAAIGRFNKIAAFVVTLKNAQTDESHSIFAANQPVVGCQWYFTEMASASLVAVRQLEHREIEVTRKHWNSVTFESIGKLFGASVQHLAILHDSKHMLDIEMYRALLARFTKVDTFSLIIQHNVRDVQFLSKLFRVIRDHLVPLRELHLCFVLSDKINHGEFPELRTEEYESTLRSLSKFSMNCYVSNQRQVIQSVGRNDDVIGALGLRRTVPLQALSFVCEFGGHQLDKMLAHNPALRQITRLQLIEFWHFDYFRAHLERFIQLESIQLWANRENWDLGYIFLSIPDFRALARLNHLSELSLFGIGIRHINREFEPTQRMSNIRRLHVVKDNFINTFIEAEFNDNYDIKYIMTRFDIRRKINVRLIEPRFACLARLFPNLEQLTIEADLVAIRRFQNKLIRRIHGLFNNLTIDNIRLIQTRDNIDLA